MLLFPICTCSGTGLESRFLEAAFNNSGDLCSIRQICTLKMIVHDYHNMQHATYATPNHTHINRL